MLQENKNKNVVVLFSGGIDCSLVSLLLRKEGYRVHLLHYDHGASISNGLHCKLRSNGMPVPLLRNGYSIFNGTKYR